jgi:cellulose synthase/poly-beta-1,6-N-acetylglucosamine synthase-like glycosyltransferase
MTGAGIVFWVSVIAILYAYLGYPILLWILSFFMAKKTSEGTAAEQYSLPRMTLIVSAYNEERVIGDKIRNALSLDYPADLLEIVVVSDGSTDRTTEIVSEFASSGVVLRHYERRVGKTACLNRAVPLATGEIIVFSDANSLYTKRALTALAQRFHDGTVGFVTGWTRYGAGKDMATRDSLGLYAKLELINKELESRLGSCVGADGAIFAIRKNLYVPLQDYDINDFVIPLKINYQGYRGVLDRNAYCFEKDAGGTKGEFQRQVRITNRTIRAIINYRQLLNPFKFGFFSIQLFSHKVSRFLVPFFLVGVTVSNLLLVSRGSFFVMTLLAQALLYAAAIASFRVSGNALPARFGEAAKAFIIVNFAILIGWIKYMQGETYTTWSPTQR